MTARSTVFAALSIRPHRASELATKLAYSKHTIYKALESLADDKLIRKRKENGKTVAEVSDDYAAQKLREIYIKSLSHGIDPGKLTGKSTIAVWKRLTRPRSLRGLQRSTGFSYPWVRKIARFLVDSNLAVYKKRKPMIVGLNETHELNKLLGQYAIKGEKKPERVYYWGTTPFERLIRTPAEIERILYEKIDSSLAIKGTGFMIRGEGKLTVLESVDKELELEELFLREIQTSEGVEDFCIRLIASGKLDYERLLDIAKERNLVNVVGCYFDILNDIRKLVDSEVVSRFQRNLSRRDVVFLKAERRYGKNGWEERYEEKWNVDLYLDLGAIRHGVRSI
ncbi:MAG: hypothetical protein ACE5QW_07540 [Thermoplasmata archaeon]